MSNIRKHGVSFYDFRLSNFKYWDLHITPDNINWKSYPEPSEYLLSSFDLSTINTTGQSITSSILYSDAINNTSGICNTQFTGLTSGFTMTPVSGNTYCYNLTGNTFSGGFYQGFYKLHEYDYQVLPTRYLDGISLEFWLQKNDVVLDECDDRFLLNDIFTENKGFFFFWGLKSPNPYCGYEISGVTCENVAYQSDIQIDYDYPWESTNPYLYYTEENVCNPPEINETHSYEECCEGLMDNAWGVRITDEGKINVRIFASSGYCEDTSYKEILMVEDYESDAVFSGDTWNHIIIKFTPYEKLNECDINDDPKLGTLSIFLNVKRVMYIDNFKEFLPYALDIDRSLQLGIPYNMSLGGGTLGNVENSNLLLNVDSKTNCEYNICISNNVEFQGLQINGISYSSETLSVIDDRDEIITFIENLIDGEVNRYHVEGICANQFVADITLYQSKNANEDFEIYFLLSGNLYEATLGKCVTIADFDGPCYLLEEYFAGSFIGYIDCFNIYNKGLLIQDIRSLYDNKKGDFNIEDEIICCS
jgi:hypothetical protein